jgi:MFS transporter, YQGE family, putative transporter
MLHPLQTIQTIRTVILLELSHWKALTKTARDYMVSISLAELAGPMLYIFTYAYIFKTTSSIEASSLMNLGWYISISAVFYINGLLLKRFSIKSLYSVGMVFTGLANMLIFVLPITKPTLFMIGFLTGIPMGLYWANRNYLTLSLTADNQRNYFKSLETIFPTIINITLPPIIGLSVVYLEKLGYLDLTQIYQIWMIVSLVFMIVGVLVTRAIPMTNPQPKVHFLSKVSKSWQKIRLVRLIQGLANGALIFLPPVIILSVLGNESVLGNTRALMSLGSVVVIYWFGTRGKIINRFRDLKLAYWSFFFLSLAFAYFFNVLGVLLFLAGLTVFEAFSWTALETIIMKSIDDEEDGDDTNNFAYIADQELFLNIGRVAGVIGLITLGRVTSPLVSLRALPVMLAGSQLLLVAIVKRARDVKNA